MTSREVARVLVLPLLLRLSNHAEEPSAFKREVNLDGTLTIYKIPSDRGVGCPTGTLVIPDAIEGRVVTRLGGHAFGGCHALTRITTPVSVTSIGENALSGRSGLIRIGIPDSGTDATPTPIHRQRP